jgi:hypothetical protein
MEALPQLVLDLVCGYLANSERPRADLLAFASASRICRAAAWREQYSQVTIDVDDAQYHQRLERLECILDEAKSRACVRTLRLGVRTDNRIEREDDEAFVWLTKSVSISSQSIYPLRYWKPRTGPRPDEFWQPLARFISCLHLKELVWTWTEQLPRCVLSVLNEQVPTCRLHVHGFDLRSLHQRDTLQNIEETEYILATSPCLYNIVAPYSMYDWSGCTNYNGDATLELSAGLAPNLKHVLVWDNSAVSSGETESRRNPRLEWRGFHPQSENEWREIPETKGQVQNLAIDAIHAVSGFQLASWECHTDFAVLRSLQLARQIKLDALQNLADLAERDGLSRLESMNLPAISCEFEERIDAESAMTRLCASLNPLSELRIVRPGITSFEAILKRHGDSLEVFCVEEFILSAHQIVQLRELCPRVKRLSIEILRSSGDHIEVDIYRTLGSMRHLESMSLMLRCTESRQYGGPDDPRPLTMPSEKKEDQEAMKTAIRRVFVNAAVDRSLAQSIFQQVLAAHASTKAGLPPRLSSIRFRVGRVPVLNDQIMSPDFQGILAWIGRGWMCRRDPRDTHQSSFTIEEVDSDTRLCKCKGLEDDIDELCGSEQYADVWKALWPETRADWRESWQSILLASNVDISQCIEFIE